MDLTPFQQELAKSGIQALVVVVGLVAGWAVLRRQERIKREEELWAGLRKLRADALVKGLEALARFHNMKDRRIQFEAATALSADEIEEMRGQEVAAYREAIDVQASQQFLLGPLGPLLGECIRAMARAESAKEVSKAVAGLHAALERWIPPLEPVRKR